MHCSKRMATSGSRLLPERGLTLGDSVVGANLSAAAAADALVGIDAVDVAGSDSSYGANGLASAACDAVVTNYVSHNF